MNEATQNGDGSGDGGRPTALVIVDHGSRFARANAVLETVARQIACRADGRYVAVEPAHMELAEPTIGAAFRRCVEAGAAHVVVALFFLSPGRHSREDIPRMTRAAAATFPSVSWCVTEPLGADNRLAELVLERARAAR